MSSTITLRVSESEKEFFSNMARFYNKGVSEIIREKAIEALEDEYDLQCYNEAMEKHRKNPVTFTHEEVKRELGL